MTYSVTITALPHATPEIIRLRRLLKLALRGFAMECNDVREIPAGDSGSDTQPHKKYISIDMKNTCDKTNTDCVSVGRKNHE
jgi:hypothetical protein